MTKRLLLLIYSKIKSIFDRSISFTSRVEYSAVSKKAKVWRFCKVFHSSIDDYSYIGPGCRVVHAHIGKFCSIAGGSAIGMGNHSLDTISTSSIFTERRNGTGFSWTNKDTYEEYKDISPINENDVKKLENFIKKGQVYRLAFLFNLN